MSNLTGNQDLMLHDPAWTGEAFFSTHTPADDATRWTTLFGAESRRAQWDLLFDRPHPKRVSDPVLVIGADEDGCCPRYSVRVTARAYHTTAEMFPDIGHDDAGARLGRGGRPYRQLAHRTGIVRTKINRSADAPDRHTH